MSVCLSVCLFIVLLSVNILKTDPALENASVTPNANANSLPSNQKEVKRFWTTVKAPLPEPKSNRPNNMSGNMADVPYNMEPAVKMDDPTRHKKEKRNSPMELPSLSMRNPAKMTRTALVHA